MKKQFASLFFVLFSLPIFAQSQEIVFNNKSSILTLSSKIKLDSIGIVLAADTSLRALIQHEVSTSEKLQWKRGQSVLKYLVQNKGINGENIYFSFCTCCFSNAVTVRIVNREFYEGPISNNLK
jgi:hypothetical protein